MILPSQFQPALPREQLILNEKPDAESVEMDVVFVGGGPAGLAGAIRLAQLVQADNELGEVNIAVLEKAESLGEHCLSGAIINPVSLQQLFPDLKIEDFPFRGPVTGERVMVLTEERSFPIPAPPTMQNHGNYIASICEVVRWLGEKAEGLGVNLFTGFPAASLLVDGKRVIGVRTTPTGLDRSGNPGSGYNPPTDITAKVTALAEGTRGTLAQAYLQWQEVSSPNPQIFALGVKEIWETKKPLDHIVHTMGWPLPGDAFGGSFMYPLEPNVVALGLVVGLDYHNQHLDVHELLQRMKQHAVFREYLEGGELVEWGAKTIPEGGYYSLPERRHGDGIVILGDSAGFVEVASLKGIHYAVQSGIAAANAIYAGLKKGDTSAAALKPYDDEMNSSYVVEDLRKRRNMRLAFKSGFFMGGFKAVLMTLTGGAFPGGFIEAAPDAAEPRVDGGHQAFVPDNKLTYRKLDAVFKSGNATRDDIPSHLIVGKDIPREVAEFYTHVCPAGVYELEGDKLTVNAPNCVDCKATDVLGPRWTPREGGSGPKYRRM
ncbi:MAG TPA: electron-transfer flavoprotein:ubiquinone oxidoreductase [Longimicrobiales bacterium]|nr:electron-transfer flavoprotein:ubiquinone oxidoreductase [Longimicrobiales bacterium]